MKSFNTPPASANPDLTPPKTSSPGKWLANHDNLAKRVKTYISPAPFKNSATSHIPDESAVLPQFDFSPVSSLDKEPLTQGRMTSLSAPMPGKPLAELLQGDFGLASDPSKDPVLAAHPETPANKVGHDSQANTLGKPPDDSSSMSSSHRDGSLPEDGDSAAQGSVASEITVPNTFDSLFKDNIELTVTEDLTQADQLVNASLVRRPPIEPARQVHHSPDTIMGTSSLVVKTSTVAVSNNDLAHAGCLVEPQSLAPSSRNAMAATLVRDKQALDANIDFVPATASFDAVQTDIVREIGQSADNTAGVFEIPLNSMSSVAVEPQDTNKTDEGLERPLDRQRSGSRDVHLTGSLSPLHEQPSQLVETIRHSTTGDLETECSKDRPGALRATSDGLVNDLSDFEPSANADTLQSFKTPAKMTCPLEASSTQHMCQEEGEEEAAEEGEGVSAETVVSSQAEHNTPLRSKLDGSVRRSSQRIIAAPVATPQPSPTKSTTNASRVDEKESAEIAVLRSMTPIPEPLSIARTVDSAVKGHKNAESPRRLKHAGLHVTRELVDAQDLQEIHKSRTTSDMSRIDKVTGREFSVFPQTNAENSTPPNVNNFGSTIPSAHAITNIVTSAPKWIVSEIPSMSTRSHRNSVPVSTDLVREKDGFEHDGIDQIAKLPDPSLSKPQILIGTESKESSHAFSGPSATPRRSKRALSVEDVEDGPIRKRSARLRKEPFTTLDQQSVNAEERVRHDLKCSGIILPSKLARTTSPVVKNQTRTSSRNTRATDTNKTAEVTNAGRNQEIPSLKASRTRVQSRQEELHSQAEETSTVSRSRRKDSADLHRKETMHSPVKRQTRARAAQSSTAPNPRLAIAKSRKPRIVPQAALPVHNSTKEAPRPSTRSSRSKKQ